MVINTNNAAQKAANNLGDSQDALGKSLSRLSSGSRIVNPSDDAAGLAVSSRLAARIDRLSAARDNVANATSFTQTQDGYMKSIGNAFTRMGELSMMAMDPTKGADDLELYDAEFQQMKGFIRETTDRKQNGIALFDGTDWEVTQDSEGNTFKITKPDLNSPAYDVALAGDKWMTSIDLWQTTENGFITKVDLWKTGDGQWHTIDPGAGATKHDAGSFFAEVPNLDNPFMRMTFTTDARDDTGNGHDGTVTGATHSGAGGNPVFEFDGDGDKITFPDTGLPTGNSDRTMSAWFRLDSTAGSTDKTFFRYGNLGSDNQSMGLVLRNGELTPTAWGASNEYVISGNLADGDWHHVAWTLNSGTAKTYLDGVLADTRSFTPNTVLSSGVIGYNSNTSSEDWNGGLDDINVFDRALTVEEITSMMNTDAIVNDEFSDDSTAGDYVAVDPTATGNGEDLDATKIAAGTEVDKDPTAADPGATQILSGINLKDQGSAALAMATV